MRLRGVLGDAHGRCRSPSQHVLGASHGPQAQHGPGLIRLRRGDLAAAGCVAEASEAAGVDSCNGSAEGAVSIIPVQH